MRKEFIFITEGLFCLNFYEPKEQIIIISVKRGGPMKDGTPMHSRDVNGTREEARARQCMRLSAI